MCCCRVEFCFARLIAFLELIYKVALIAIARDGQITMGMALLCALPLLVLFSIQLRMPLLLIPTLVYNFIWMVLMGLACVGLLLEFVFMHPGWIDLLNRLANYFKLEEGQGQQGGNIKERDAYLITFAALVVAIAASSVLQAQQSTMCDLYRSLKGVVAAGGQTQQSPVDTTTTATTTVTSTTKSPSSRSASSSYPSPPNNNKNCLIHPPTASTTSPPALHQITITYGSAGSGNGSGSGRVSPVPVYISAV